MDAKFYLHSLAIPELVTDFVGVAKSLSYLSGKIHLTTNTENKDCDLSEKSINATLAYYANKPFIECTRGRLTGQSGYDLVYEVPDGQLPMLKLTVPDNQKGLLDEALTVLHTHFSLLPRSTLVRESLSHVQREQLNYRESLLTELSRLAAELTRTSAEQVRKHDEWIQDALSKLNSSFMAKEKQLDESFRKKEDDLASREKEFAEKVAQFDARDRTVVRRDLLQQIRKIIEEQKGESKVVAETLKRRLFIHILCIASLGLAAVFAGAFAYRVFQSPSVDWHLMAPLTAGVILFSSTLIFYLNWNNRWFSDLAQADFANRKFASDIVRAGWIAELFFEWKEQKEIEFPRELLASFTRDLFMDSNGAECELHPMDRLVKQLDRITKLKIGGDTGIEITKK